MRDAEMRVQSIRVPHAFMMQRCAKSKERQLCVFSSARHAAQRCREDLALLFDAAV